MITEPVISEEDKEFIHNELSRPTFVWKDQNTDIEELEKKLAILEKKVENKVDKSTENIVDKSKVKTAKKTTTKKSNSNLTKEEEEKIQKDLAKAVEKYENKETEEMEKKLSKAIAKHSSVNHKKANMNMTKDELLKFAAKNDVYATEDMTKAEIIEKINMETQPESKSKKK